MSIRSIGTQRALSEKAPRYVVRRSRRATAAAATAGAASRPADQGPLRWQAYERFQQQIVASRIRPGQFVSQRELAALMGLPLGAIREVIPRLEAEGLLQTAPQRGLQIATVDVKLVRNAFQLRLMIEREAAGQFSLTATDTELDTLEATHRSVIERAGRGVSPELLDEAQAIDWGLHDRMVDALGNEIISNLYRVNSLRIRLIRLDRVMLDEHALEPAMNEHLALIEALRTRDPGHAIAAIDGHLMHARNRALGL